MSLLRALGPVAAALALLPPAVAKAAPDEALASASYGTAEVWWQHTADNRSQRELVFQASPTAAPLVLGVPSTGSPRNYTGLALGLDARGKLVVVVESNRGLRWTRVTGRTRLHAVPGSKRTDARPSLFRGRLACIGIVRGFYATVRLGSLAHGGLRPVWETRADDAYYPQRAGVGAGGSVAVITHREGAGAGAFRALLLRPRRATKQLLPTLALGHSHDGALSIENVSPDGRRVTILRRFDEQSNRFVFALTSGRRITGAG